MFWGFDPIVQTALESPKSLETTGVAGRCKTGWGTLLTPAFSPAFLSDTCNPGVLGKTAQPKPRPQKPHTAPEDLSAGTFSTRPPNRPHGASHGSTGGLPRERRQGLVFLTFLLHCPELGLPCVLHHPAQELLQRLQVFIHVIGVQSREVFLPVVLKKYQRGWSCCMR